MLALKKTQKIAYLIIGSDKKNTLSIRLKSDVNSDTYFFSGNAGAPKTKETIEPQSGQKAVDSIGNIAKAQQLISQLKEKNYDAIVIGVHNYSRRPANNYGLSSATIYLLNQLQQQQNTVTLFFGNPYAIKFSANASNLIACYEDDDSIQQAAADILEGKAIAKGKLPVTVSENLKYGLGLGAADK